MGLKKKKNIKKRRFSTFYILAGTEQISMKCGMRTYIIAFNVYAKFDLNLSHRLQMRGASKMAILGTLQYTTMQCPRRELTRPLPAVVLDMSKKTGPRQLLMAIPSS